MKQWYESFFDNFANQYEREGFTQGTVGECDFIEQEIGFDKTKKILDVGCGTGRHAIELVKRGYTVTGVDLSESQLRKARENAKSQNVNVTFIKADARNLTFSDEFDLCLLICEGAFPLMETDEMNFQILEGIARALKPSGKFILTTLNALFPLYHSVKDFLNADLVEMVSKENTFDLLTFRDISTVESADDDGNMRILHCNERYYTPSEITWLLKTLNFTDIGIYNAKLGSFSRNDSLTTDDFEMLVVATKK